MLFTFKDKVSKVLRCTLLYDFKWNTYNGVYYCKVICQFKVRVCEHLTITPLMRKKPKTKRFI